MIDQIRIDSQLQNSGLRVRAKVATTGSAVGPTNAPVSRPSPQRCRCLHQLRPTGQYEIEVRR